MKTTTRRKLLKVAAAGGAAAAGLGAILGSGRAIALGAAPLDESGSDNEHHAHGQSPAGKRTAATMSFGEWGVSAPGSGLPGPLDRFSPPTASPNNRNVHLLLPAEVQIDAGGSVNFIIAGFHLILIYEDGVEMGEIDTTKLTPESTPPGLIDDPVRRIYRGLDPRALAYVPAPGQTANFPVRDRVEVVQFPAPGRYFVTCGVLPHFNDGMNGYINVKELED